jgi:hypothetical protein
MPKLKGMDAITAKALLELMNTIEDQRLFAVTCLSLIYDFGESPSTDQVEKAMHLAVEYKRLDLAEQLRCVLMGKLGHEIPWITPWCPALALPGQQMYFNAARHLLREAKNSPEKRKEMDELFARPMEAVKRDIAAGKPTDLELLERPEYSQHKSAAKAN